MKLSPKDQESLVSLLARLCDDIFGIESAYCLFVSQADLRPRIDYFHDAIRALTAPNPTQTQQSRLAIERLAYDVQALRYLADKPLAALSKESGLMSPATAVVKTTPSLVATNKKPDREAKEQLSQGYKQYGMLFAALLKPTADLDYQERTDTLNEQVESMNEIIDALKNQPEALAHLAENTEDKALRAALIAFMKQSKGKQKASLPALLTALKINTTSIDKAIKTIDTAHHNYATSQLGIYETSKDLLKKMAGSGMNIVGAFVEASIRSTRSERGR